MDDGWTSVEAAEHVRHDREEHEHRGHQRLRERVDQPEPVVDQRGERDDRDGVGGHGQWQQDPAGGHETGGDERDRQAGQRADQQPDQRLLEGRDRRRQEREPAVGPVRLERGEDRRGLREDEPLQVERADGELPRDDRGDEHDDGGEILDHPAAPRGGPPDAGARRRRRCGRPAGRGDHPAGAHSVALIRRRPRPASGRPKRPARRPARRRRGRRRHGGAPPGRR